MPDAPSIGVAIVNWNGGRDTLICLESLLAAKPSPKAVVVVDNGSSDDSARRLTEWAAAGGVAMGVMPNVEAAGRENASGWLTLILTGENLGFSGGTNVGLRFLRDCTDVSHFLLLNNDATVSTDYFHQIGMAIDREPDAGLMGGTIYHEPERDRVWYAGGAEIPLRALVVHHLEVPASVAPVPTQFITGCAMVISRPAIERIGLLPECYYPAYSEDVEYSHRARRAGLKVLYAPAAAVYHKVGASAGPATSTPWLMEAQVRHRVLFVRRNYHGARRYVALAYLAATKPGRALIEVLRGRPRMAAALLRGAATGFVARTGHPGER